MPSRPPKGNDSRILIIGAGVFGLTTTLHLARRGYKDIHLFDPQPYHRNDYRCDAGCDAASADENKVIRASYGGKKLYQDLAFGAIGEWEAWNGELGRRGEEAVFVQGGLARLSDGGGLEGAEVRSQECLPGELRGMQFRVSDAGRRADAMRAGVGWGKLDPFGLVEKAREVDGYLDCSAGFVLASRACAFALGECVREGVGMHLGEGKGMRELVREEGQVEGVVTQDGEFYEADLVILACGGWTPALLPEIEDLVETTAGSVLSFRLPPERRDLWERFSPETFPVWCWNMTTYDHDHNPLGGIFGFPRTPEGVVKICFTGAQWTNYTQRSRSSGKEISFPKTDGEKIPGEAMDALRTFCADNLPELLDLEPETVRLCWYSDSVGGSFLIDYVPGTEGLMVCNGGSGHGFKFLPVLGEHVVDVLEGKETEYTRLFAWRDVPEGKRNGLEEGPQGWRTLGRQKMVGREAWRI